MSLAARERPARPPRKPLAGAAAPLCIALALAGCAAVQVPYGEMADAVQQGAAIDPLAMRDAWLAQTDDETRDRLEELETEAVELLPDEPLRLGTIGAAVLDLYFGSLAGHLAMAAFYSRVEVEADASRHRAWASAIAAAIDGSSSGTVEDPHEVLSAIEARAFLAAIEEQPIGSIYVSTDEHPYLLQILARGAEARPRYRAFTVPRFFEGVFADIERGDPDDYLGEINFGMANVFLAKARDSAAQTFVGYSLGREQRFDEAAAWLTPAAQNGNVIATLVLAQLYRALALDGDPSQHERALANAEESYLAAIRAGSDEAMAALGALYLSRYYGAGKVAEGVDLLKRAAEAGNTDAMVFLANEYAAGRYIELDYDASEHYWVKAADLDDEVAKLQYARFLMVADVAKEFNDQAWKWLRDVARNENPEAMVLIGALYARGVHVDRSYRRARIWFRNAVRTAPDDPRIVNEVAWTLAVSNRQRLRDARYALKIMDRVMASSDEARQSPAFLDTWAAALAANGNFDRAIEVQQKAVEQARRRDETSVIPVLKEHLEAFRAGEVITEAIP